MPVKAVRWKIARRHLNQRRPRRWRWVVPLMLFLFLLASAAGVGTAAYLFASNLPSANTFHIHFDFQDARIYDASGKPLFTAAYLTGKNGGRRIVEPLQDRFDSGNACRGGTNRIPLVLQNATIATEDATFYKNPGFDPWSIVRAAYQNLTYGHIVSGASTITQQLVRQYMLTDKRTLNRKAEEVALAYEISKRFPKRRILWYYLNTVPYGNTAYGSAAASLVYFGKPVCALDMAEAALLAGLPRAPTDYNPVRHPTAALSRMRTVLQLLRKHGYIHSRAAVLAAQREASRWRFYPAHVQMRYPQFVRYALDQFAHLPGLGSQLYRGIDIYTTLDPRLQDAAQSTVTRQIDGLAAQHVTDGALVSLDLRPGRYGWILAMVGSAHYRGTAGQINMTIRPRQPGSSMKPFNYIWAFEHGAVGPATQIQDSPVVLPDPNDTKHGGWYAPINYDHLFHGTVTVRQALANSLNVPAVKTEFYVTRPARVAGTAYRFGMHSLYADNPHLDCRVCWALTLGGLSGGTRLLEETSAYGVFGSGGYTVPTVAIWKVVRRSTGQVLYCSQACPHGVRPDPALIRARQQVLDAAHAYEMTNVLSDNDARCTVQVCEFGLNSKLLLSRPSAAKTGTTNDFTDNWTVGYTPQIVTGVWAGNADRTAMRHVLGVTGAAPIWHDFMERAFRILRLPARQFATPAQVEQVNTCTDRSGRIAGTTPDVYVTPVGGDPSSLPMCSLPDRGYLPVPCNRYPARILPLNFRCPSGLGGYIYSYSCNPRCMYTYTYRNGVKVQAPAPVNGIGVPPPPPFNTVPQQPGGVIQSPYSAGPG